METINQAISKKHNYILAKEALKKSKKEGRRVTKREIAEEAIDRLVKDNK